ncbi:MAG TPA: hypothetical protein VK003_19985 [Oceanobacillus sp.]|nr:hypothetical protein [Oceanobacillus sp.]
MTVIEVVERSEEMTQRQRWSHYFVLIYAVVAIFVGLQLRDSALYATVPYVNTQVGIRAYYPQNWLIDTDGDYVFRVRDMTQTGYKTTIEVNVIPVTPNTTARNLFDNLILNRSQILAEFNTLSRGEPYMLPDEREATAMSYVFVGDTGGGVFLESVPVVVEGIDILTFEGDQAIIITFLSDADDYDEHLAIFERFLNDFEF